MLYSYTRLTALLTGSLCLLVSCSPGPNIVDVFINPPAKLKTNNCDDVLNGDWKLKQVFDETGKKQEIEIVSYYSRVLLRFKINQGCDDSTLIFAVKLGSKSSRKYLRAYSATGKLATKVKFPGNYNGSYFSFNIRENGQGDNQFMIVKYNMPDSDTLEISLASKTFLVKAIRNKLIPGTISKRFGDPYVSASSQQLDDFIRKHSTSMFQSKMIYVRIQHTQWFLKKTINAF